MTALALIPQSVDGKREKKELIESIKSVEGSY